jgi:hypothetical protein
MRSGTFAAILSGKTTRDIQRTDCCSGKVLNYISQMSGSNLGWVIEYPE